MLNKRAEYNKFRLNPEKAKAYDLKGSGKALFTMASGLKLDQDFYNSPQQKLDEFRNLIDGIRDAKLVIAYANFLSEYLGIKLAPVVMLTHIALSRSLTWQEKNSLRVAVYNVFDRPDKFANAFGYTKYLFGNAKSMPPFFKKMLRLAFANMKEHTIIKNKLQSREIKTADIIKILHPVPKNDRMSQVYKALIENDRSLIARNSNDIVSVLSSSVSKAEKSVKISNNLNKTPINALIRNLKNVPVSAENVNTVTTRLRNVLKVKNGMPEVRQINPFDLLSAGLNIDPNFGEVLDNALSKFMSDVSIMDGGSVSILVDVSGSMNHRDTDIVAKYLAMMLPAMSKAKVSIQAFSSRLYKEDVQFTNAIRLSKSMVSNYYSICNKFARKPENTALADAVRSVLRHDKPDLVIVFSDEVSWSDRGDSIVSTSTPVLAINPRPMAFSAFDPTGNVLRVGSLDAKIFYFIPLIAEGRKFDNWVISLLNR